MPPDCYEMAINHCLDTGGKHVEPAHLRLMLDCAEICQTSANFRLNGSDLHHLTCGVCAEVSRRLRLYWRDGGLRRDLPSVC